MKNLFMGILIILLIFSITIIGCDNGNNDNGNGNDLILTGTSWICTEGDQIPQGGIKITFTSATEWEEVLINTPSSKLANGTYSISSNNISITTINAWNGSALVPSVQTYNGTISNNVMTLNWNGTIVFNKQL